MKPTDFFALHPVFRYDEFVAAHSIAGGRSLQTSRSVLKQHVAAGNLLHIRRGMYAVVPRGVDLKSALTDPYLVATKLTDDGVVAYHAALQFYGKAYSIWRRIHYLTRHRVRPFTFGNLEFVPVLAPLAVRSLDDLGGGIVERRHAGGTVRVSTLERTLVDVLDRPGKGGGWEETWRSLELVEFFDFDAVIDYAMRLESAITVARLGFFLEQHRNELMVEDRHLDLLRARAPRGPRYMDSARKPGKLVPGWNLVVPEAVLERRWREGE